ncbi:MAG: hypothetical protein O7D91_21630 [Planctomycetota bacterium]|nr:hypothetical protein [Planctomycetota bacterium]
MADLDNRPSDYDICFANAAHPFCDSGQAIGPLLETGLPSATYVYTAYKVLPSHATWRYEVNTTVLHNYWNLKMAGMTGNVVTLAAELANLEDDCPGTSQNKCYFNHPHYRATTPLWDWTPLFVVQGDMHNSDLTEWTIELWNDGIPGSPVSVRMWDLFPN